MSNMLTREKFAEKLDELVGYCGVSKPTGKLLQLVQVLLTHEQELRDGIINTKLAEMDRTGHLERLILKYVRVGDDDTGTAVQQIENVLHRLVKALVRVCDVAGEKMFDADVQAADIVENVYAIAHNTLDRMPEVGNE